MNRISWHIRRNLPSFVFRGMATPTGFGRAIVAVGVVAAGVAACVGALSLFGPHWFRDAMHALAPDDHAATMDRFSDGELRRLLAGTAVVAGVAAAWLLACRGPLSRLLAAESPPPTWRTARTSRIEAAVAAVLIGTTAVLAARNLLLPLRLDETLTVFDYVIQPFGKAWSRYQLNNHVLHTLLAWVAHRLGGTSPVALRLPAFIAGCSVLLATWWFVRREYGWPAAALATALLGASPLFLEYMSNARGYTLMLLCFVAALGCGGEAARRPSARRWWLGYSTALGLGFFAVPVMAFPAAAAVCWLLLLCWRERGAAALPRFALQVAAWSGLGLALAALLYAPVLLEWGPVDYRHVPLPPRWPPWDVVSWHTVETWLRWHAATPLWAQLALLVALAAGVAVPGRGRHRGLLAVAAIAGTATVLLARPTLLHPRMTLWLLFVVVVLVGAGGAVLLEALLERAKLGVRKRGVAYAIVVAVVFGTAAWQATRPATVKHFAEETGGPIFPVPLRPNTGDYVAAEPPLADLVASKLLADGYGLSPSRTDLTFLRGRPMHVRQVSAHFGELAGPAFSKRRARSGQDPIWWLTPADRSEGDVDRTDGRAFWLLVDEMRQPGWRYDELGKPYGLREMEALLVRRGCRYSVFQSLPGSQVLRLTSCDEPLPMPTSESSLQNAPTEGTRGSLP